MLLAEGCTPQRWRALLPTRARGRSAGELQVPLSWGRSSGASLGALVTHYPRIAPEQQDGSRSQRRVPACSALARLQDCMACPACAASIWLHPCPSGTALGTGSVPASSAAAGDMEGCMGSQRGINDCLMGFSRSPLKPAVPEQRLQSGGSILLSWGKCSRARCSLFLPPGPVSQQLLEAGKYTVTYFPERAKCI